MAMGKYLFTMALVTAFSVPSFAQTKPAETTSKLKKVLHYTKCGGYIHVDGQRDMTAVLNILAAKKGFTVTHSGDATLLNLANLKTFSAIIWDNNVDGGASVPDPAQRQAVLDYVNQGGGWLLVHGAGDHHNSWNTLQTVLGTTFSTHGNQGAGDITYDAEATKHKELKYMVQGLPPKARITKDEWYSFQNTVRGKAGVTVVAIAGGGTSDVILPLGDNSKPEDHSYVWAKDMGTGRSLYTAIGHGGNQLYAQADSFAVKSVYENLRYVAGDYQNGCTNANASNFNAAARVDDGSCVTTGLQGSGKTESNLEISYHGMKTSMDFAHDGRFTLELRNVQGAVVWHQDVSGGTQAQIDPQVLPGVYYLTAKNRKSLAKQKMLLF
jgi:hypothetical protein